MSPLMMYCYSIFGTFGLGFLAALLPLQRLHRARLSLALTLLGGILAFFWSLFFISRSSSAEVMLVTPYLSAPNMPSVIFGLYVDRLVAFFMLLVSGFSIAVSIYSFDYLGLHDRAVTPPETDADGISAAYSLFVGVLLLVLAANDVVFLLISLEVSSLAFGYLVLFRHNKGRDMQSSGWSATDRRARKIAIQSYLISSHISLALFMVALLLRAGQVESFSFDAFRASMTPSGPLIFGLAFVGLAIRAGVAPFHIWVPLAHPSSPTNTHALSLGVAIKVAIYLMIRVFFQFLGPIPSWWGQVVLLFAGLTAIVGVFYAITSRDLKTALSYHSVENIGIILFGVGLALVLASADLRTRPGALELASLALIAALYHALNHAVFKGLLYLCTGAIERLTGTVEYHHLGGLIKRFPWTSASFLVGAVSIAGFPPFNGFISEWLTLQGLFGILTFPASGSLFLPMSITAVATVCIALSMGLTAFAFVKIAGTSVLGAPRSIVDRRIHEVPWFVRIIFAILGGLCLLLGVIPGRIVGLLAQVTLGLGLPSSVAFRSGNLVFEGARSVSVDLQYTAVLDNGLLWLLVGGSGLLIFCVLLRHRTAGRLLLQPAPVWSSAILYDSAHMQATTASYIYQVSLPTHVDAEAEGSTQKRSRKILPDRLSLSERYDVVDVFRPWYNAFLAGLLRLACWSTLRLQNGHVRWYVAYTAFTLLGLLLAWLQWGGR